MSAPDPSKWAVRFDELCEILAEDDAVAEKVIARVARRRAIEELKALLTLPSWINHSEVAARIAAIEAEEG